MNSKKGINLYIKNLDCSINDEKLRKHFSAFGEVTSCKVMLSDDEDRRFGFVCFASPDDASKAATELNGSMLSGKPIYVAQAERKEVRSITNSSDQTPETTTAAAQQEEIECSGLHEVVGDVLTFWFGAAFWAKGRNAPRQNATAYFDELWRTK